MKKHPNHDQGLFSVKRRGNKKKKSTGENRKSKVGKKGTKKRTESTSKKNIQEDLVHIQSKLISYEDIEAGQCFLGCIVEISKYQITVSLPNRMQGLLPITNISEAYKNLLVKVSEDKDTKETVYTLNELYSVGQLIVVKVKSAVLQGRRVKVILSAMPEDVNSSISSNALAGGTVIQGAIKSTEDNGFLVDTGMTNVQSAFLPLSANSKEFVVGVGSVLLCSVNKVFDTDSSSNKLRIKLTVYTSRICKPSKPRISSILPGTVIKATVEEVVTGGLKLSTAWNRGVVSWKHLKSSDEEPQSYSVGDEVIARILYVTDISSVLHCTLNTKICSQSILKDPLSGLDIGDIVEKAKVRTSDMHGVYVTLPNENVGFCAAQKLADLPVTEEFIKKHFAVDAIKQCRLISANLIDQLFIVGFKKSVLSEELYGRKKGTGNLAVGQRLEVEIKEHNDYGAVAVFSKFVNCFVPKLHLPESDNNDPEEDYPVGTTLIGRVLKISPGKDPYLTLKTDLVNSEETILSSYDENNVGAVVDGCVTKVFETGLLMEFLGGLRAYIRKDKRGQSLTELSSVYEGMVLKCKIISVDEENSKMTATLDLEENKSKMLNIGDIVNCTVLSVEQDKVYVKMDHFGMEAYIPKCHISDDLEISDSLYRVLKEGDVIDNAIVYRKEVSAIILSTKPSVVQHANLNKDNINDDIKPGYICPAVITQVLDDEIEVSILHKGKTDSNHFISNEYLPTYDLDTLDKSDLIEGQTLFVSCLRMDNNLPTFSSLVKDVMKDRDLSCMQLLYNTLCVERQVQFALSRSKPPFMFRKVQIGKTYSGKVMTVCEFGALVNVQSLGIDGVIEVEHYDNGFAPSVAETIGVTVIHIDHRQHCLELTARRDLKRMRLVKDHNVLVGQKCICQVLLAKREYIVARLKNVCVGQLVYLPTARHWNDLEDRASAFEIGEECEIVVKHVHEELILGELKRNSSSNSEPLNLITKLPEIKIRNGIPASSLSQYNLSASVTKFDFANRASDKVRRVTEARKIPQGDRNNSKSDHKPSKSRKRKDSDAEVIYPKRSKLDHRQTDDDDLQSVESDTQSIKESNKKKLKTKKINKENSIVQREEDQACLQIASSGFDWTGSSLKDKPEIDENSSSDDEDQKEKEQKTVKRKTKFERMMEAKKEELKVRELELQRLDPNREPETALDFEERIERNPHSSTVWIEYVSFYLENAETEKAKGVAARSLQVVPPTLEDARLALWNVVLRLEVMYGTPESVETSFKEAIATNDELKIFYIMLDIYANANKLKDAEHVICRMTKKYSHDKEVWIKAFTFFFKANQFEEARNIFDKSLICLHKQDHMDIINRFAQFEIKYGDVERGKTIFERMISNCPKRTDIWNVYVDLLIKMDDVKGARNVLERMTGLKLRMNAMKTIFKKFLNFEKQFGTNHSVEGVKARAADYITSKLPDN